MISSFPLFFRNRAFAALLVPYCTTQDATPFGLAFTPKWVLRLYVDQPTWEKGVAESLLGASSDLLFGFSIPSTVKYVYEYGVMTWFPKTDPQKIKWQVDVVYVSTLLYHCGLDNWLALSNASFGLVSKTTGLLLAQSMIPMLGKEEALESRKKKVKFRKKKKRRR